MYVVFCAGQECRTRFASGVGRVEKRGLYPWNHERSGGVASKMMSEDEPGLGAWD